MCDVASTLSRDALKASTAEKWVCSAKVRGQSLVPHTTNWMEYGVSQYKAACVYVRVYVLVLCVLCVCVCVLHLHTTVPHRNYRKVLAGGV